MARHKGPINFDGSLGNFRSYFDPSTGKQIDGETGGPTSEEFWANPNYEPAQKRAIEMGGRSKWASLLKLGLFDIRHLMHSHAFNNIVAAGRPIQALDETKEFGLRGIAANSDPGALLEIDFNKDLPFASVIREIYQIAFSGDNKTVTMTIPNFVPTRDIRRVTKYVALKFFLNISQVSEVVWNPEILKYEPVVSDLELLSKCITSEWIAKTNAAGEVILEASFDEPAFSAPGTTVLVSLDNFGKSEFLTEQLPNSNMAIITGNGVYICCIQRNSPTMLISQLVKATGQKIGITVNLLSLTQLIMFFGHLFGQFSLTCQIRQKELQHCGWPFVAAEIKLP